MRRRRGFPFPPPPPWAAKSRLLVGGRARHRLETCATTLGASLAQRRACPGLAEGTSLRLWASRCRETLARFLRQAQDRLFAALRMTRGEENCDLCRLSGSFHNQAPRIIQQRVLKAARGRAAPKARCARETTAHRFRGASRFGVRCVLAPLSSSTASHVREFAKRSTKLAGNRSPNGEP